MLAADSTGQFQGHIEAAGLGANVILEAAVGKLQRILIKALLRLAAMLIQAAQMEAEVAKMIGGNEHIYLNRAGAVVALDYDPGTIFTAQFIWPGRAQTVVVAAQAALAVVFRLFLRKVDIFV